MSLKSTIYFSSKNINELSDLEADNNVLMSDLSSRGFDYPALFFEELTFLFPKDFSKYTEESIYDSGDSSGLLELSPDFINFCASLKQKDLIEINNKINQYLKNISLQNINKLGIDNLSGWVKISIGIILGAALSIFKRPEQTFVSIFLIIIALIAPIISLIRLKLKRMRLSNLQKYDFIPVLEKLVKDCNSAKEKGLKAFYYWSL